MGRSKELIFNTIIIGIGKFASNVLSFFLLPLYTSILTTEEYGVYDLLITIAMFAVPVITLLMEEAMFRFLIDCETAEEKKTVISSTIIYILAALFVSIGIFFGITIFIDIPHKILFLLYIIVSVLLSLKNALARGLSQIKLFSISNFISSVLMILLNIFFIAVLKIGVAGLLLSHIIAHIISILFVFAKINLKQYISLKLFDKSKIKSMVKYSLPLVPNSLSWSIINLSDRIVLSSVIGTTANGVYSIANKFPSVIDSIYGFFYTAWKESAAKNLKYDDSDCFYNNVYSVLKNFMWAVIIMMIAVLPFVFSIFIKKDFAAAYYYIPLLIVSIYFSNISGFYGGIFSAYKDTKIMGVTTIIAAILNLVINILLIKRVGIWAAVLSTLLSTFVVYQYRKIKLKNYIILKENILSSILGITFLCIVMFAYYSQSWIIQGACLFVAAIYSLYINKEVIKMLFENIKLIKSK